MYHFTVYCIVKIVAKILYFVAMHGSNNSILLSNKCYAFNSI